MFGRIDYSETPSVSVCALRRRNKRPQNKLGVRWGGVGGLFIMSTGSICSARVYLAGNQTHGGCDGMVDVAVGDSRRMTQERQRNKITMNE